MSQRIASTVLLTALFGVFHVGCSDGGGGGGGGGAAGGAESTISSSFSPSAGTTIIYVSSSTGDDANDGLTESTAVATISRGKELLTSGSPDWLRLRKGDTWDEGLGQWTKVGLSGAEPMVVTTFGSGARPLLRTGSSSGLVTNGGSSSPEFIENVAFAGLHFYAHTRDPNGGSFTGTNGAAGVEWLRGTRNLLFDDCVFQFYTDNMVISDLDNLGISGISIRRCQLLDAYNIDPTHSQGIYLEGVDGVTLEDSLFDHNGWHPTQPGAEKTIFNHNVYVQNGCDRVTFRRNVVLRGSSHGIQLRPGGVVQDSVFAQNAISILLGGGDTPDPGGIDALCSGNVVLEGTDIGSGGRGQGIDQGNVNATTITDNIVAHVTSVSGNRFSIRDDPNATISGNTVFNWPGSPAFDSPGPFADPNRMIVDFNVAQGGAATFADFAARLRAQSRDTFSSAYTAQTIISYFQAGF